MFFHLIEVMDIEELGGQQYIAQVPGEIKIMVEEVSRQNFTS